MKRLIYIFLLANISLALLAQTEFYYAPDGEKVVLKVRKDKIVLKGDKGVSTDKLKSLGKFAAIEALDGVRRIATADVQEEQMDALLQKKVVDDASYMLEYSDGTLLALTEQIFVCPKSDVTIKRCMQEAGLLGKTISFELIPLENDVYMLTLDVPSNQILPIVRKLHESGLCKFAEPCFTRLIKGQAVESNIPSNIPSNIQSDLPSYTSSYASSNPLYNNQWGLQNINGIRAETAWYLTRGNGIKIAVIDDGVNLTHPDLQNNLLTGYDATTGAFSGTNGGANYWDWHGSQCAGIIAAVDNNIGVVGVAYEAKIVPIRIKYKSSPNSEFYTMNDGWCLKAIRYARDTAQVDILNCSWGDAGPTASTVWMELNYTASVGRGGKGCIVTFPTRNNGEGELGVLANAATMISVGAIDQNFNRLAKSSYGNGLDVVAPGKIIVTTNYSDYVQINTVLLDYECTYLACSFVAGVAALVLSANPSLTQVQVHNIIESTARKVGTYNYATVSGYPNGTWNNQVGYGLVDAIAAVVKANDAFIGGASVIHDCEEYGYTLLNLGYGLTPLVWTSSSNLKKVASQPAIPQLQAFTRTLCNGLGAAATLSWVAVSLNGIEIARKSVTVYDRDIYTVSASPNPVSDLLDIEIREPLSPLAETSLRQASPLGRNISSPDIQQPVFEVKIFDATTGTLAYEGTINGKTAQINVSSLPNGVYILHIYDGTDNAPQTQNIVVTH